MKKVSHPDGEMVAHSEISLSISEKKLETFSRNDQTVFLL